MENMRKIRTRNEYMAYQLLLRSLSAQIGNIWRGGGGGLEGGSGLVYGERWRNGLGMGRGRGRGDDELNGFMDKLSLKRFSIRILFGELKIEN